MEQGNYSEKDHTHWTPELKKALHFDQTKAMQMDNGMCTFFVSTYYKTVKGILGFYATYVYIRIIS